MKFANFRKCRKALAVCMLISLLGMPLSTIRAQSGPTGTLTGIVKDPSGAVLSGVTVTAKNSGTGFTRTTATGDEGRWTIPVLPVGIYEVTFETTGFKRLLRKGVEVEAAIPRTLEATLEVGEITTEVVNITGGPELVTPDTATTFRQVGDKELVSVPTSTRSFTHLLSTEAGVSTDLSPVATNGNGNLSPSVNGTRTTSTSLFFNGVDATNISSNEGSLTDNIAPAPETLAEVKLQTSLYDASTGRSGGGNFQLITKSGTNDFNGTAYYYLQNEVFNANDYFFNRDGIEKPVARRHEGGFTLGGPVVRDRIFFFGGYQGTQAKTGFVPTASSITVLPQALGLISGQRTAANIVAAFRSLNPSFNLTPDQISPLALALLNTINPLTGDFIIPSPAANAVRENVGDQGVSQTGAILGNPLVRQRNVFPAEFEQDQFTIKLDGQLTRNNRLSGTFFFSNFPGFDPFPDPSSLATPFALVRADRNRTLAISDTHTFGSALVSEVRFGFFSLNNTRRLDDEIAAITNESVGIQNPAILFDDSPATRRLGHIQFRNQLSDLSISAPNDAFNQRLQRTFSIADNVSYIRGDHTLRFGGEFKRHSYDTSLPEEQATEFEIGNFTQFLRGLNQESDTQFGTTIKNFRFRDLSWYIADDWKVNRKLTLNLGLRWDWFGWPEEENGRIGNVDFSLINDPENPASGFIVPSNVKPTGFAAIDAAIESATKVDSKHTLNGQDLNNLAPRFGFAYSPFDNSKLVVRGGYGVFFDRPSAAFINTVFSNYPFLREIEVTVPSGAVPIGAAFSQQLPNLPLNQYLPSRIVYQSNGTYAIRDSTPITTQSTGAPNPIDLVTGLPARGNIAETFEFRVVDRDLRTPYVQQWNLGFQVEVAKDLMVEARYVGTKGTKLLQAIAFNQGFDLNDPNVPDFVFRRFNEAYNAAYQAEVNRTGNPNVLMGPLRNSATTERERGRGIAFGFPNSVTGNPLDFNLSNPNGAIINFEARVPILGFNVPEALLLQSSANSIYHAAQFSLTKRLSRGLQFHAAYTFSKSLDNNSADPGSTAGGGRPDVPNVGFVVQGNQRDLRSNRGLSDFDRPHRFNTSFVYDLPSFGSDSAFLTGWQISGFLQVQSGTPYSIVSSEPAASNVSSFANGNLRFGSGGLFRLGFGRPSLCGTLDQLRERGEDPTEEAFNSEALCSPLGGFGNLGRNVLRGLRQKRFDLGLSKTTALTERVGLQFRWDVFNVFNQTNFANPNNDLEDSSDFGTISNTIGGPRVMQFGLKLTF